MERTSYTVVENDVVDEKRFFSEQNLVEKVLLKRRSNGIGQCGLRIDESDL